MTSALGQPLKANIELVSVGKAEKTSLVARLASPDVYAGAGLEYPFGNKFKFQIESRPNGEHSIKVSSAQPINDPFVSLLVELTWASGKLLREYTFLLDPPDYVAEQPKPAEVQALAPVAAPPEAVAKPVEEAAPPVAAAAEKPVAKPVAAARPAAAEPVVKRVVTGDITVRRGDTLSRIARQYKPAEVSLERMLVALYRANADQFDGKNMNRIKVGKVLRLPDQDELMDLAQTDAVREIRAQTADWNAYRQKLAAAAPSAAQPQEAQQVAAGKISSSVADKAPIAKESAKEVLKLSKGEAPGDKAAAAGGKPATAEEKKIAEQEEAIARGKGLKEEEARAALLEKNLQDMQRLAQLKSEAAALAAQPSGVAPEVAASGVVAASEVKPAPVAKPKPAPQPVVVPPPSLMDQILGKPLYLAGGAAILIGLGGLGIIVSRRRRAFIAPSAEAGGEGVGAITAHLAMPAAPSPETGDFTSAAHAAAAPHKEEVDPISEAELFLNFGRDAQAEEILKEALQNTPNDHRIHLKLLGIYANRKDVNSFSSIARRLKDSGDEEAWQQAAAMGRKLEPSNPMYGGAGAIESTGSATLQAAALGAMPDLVVGETAASETTAPAVDFDLGETEKAAAPPAEGEAAAQAEVIDFDITSTQPSVAAPPAMDFDITSTSPSMPAAAEAEAPLPNLEDLVFDITATHPSMPAAQPEAEKPAAPPEEGGMEFTLDFPIEGAAEKPAAQPPETGFAGISLNLEEIGAPAEPVSETRDEHWHEVATKLDLAKAYQEMGDATGAREILEEVLREGDEGQRQAAQAMLDQIG